MLSEDAIFVTSGQVTGATSTLIRSPQADMNSILLISWRFYTHYLNLNRSNFPTITASRCAGHSHSRCLSLIAICRYLSTQRIVYVKGLTPCSSKQRFQYFRHVEGDILKICLAV